ncbi:MAG TPA: hypothetical protein VNF47_22920 [Streptosporangiaceae bacterium]|nr:hypothetical protein [Streptosporangiaceae bacterium]
MRNDRSRRISHWTAAALVAGVAATTGYLAHAIPAAGGGSSTSGSTGSTSGSTGTTPNSGKSTVTPSGPAVQKPVVTSGGSGAAGGGRDS